MGYNTFFTWANAGYNYGSLSETHSYGTMACVIFFNEPLGTDRHLNALCAA